MLYDKQSQIRKQKWFDLAHIPVRASLIQSWIARNTERAKFADRQRQHARAYVCLFLTLEATRLHVVYTLYDMEHD